MKIRDFIFLNGQDSGSTSYMMDVCRYFKLDTSKTIEQLTKELVKIVTIKDTINVEKKKSFYFHGKKWKYDNDFLKYSGEQWERFESFIGEGKEKNINKLLAVYCRPCDIFGKPKKYDLQTQEDIENELLDLDYELGVKLNVFFCQDINIFIHYIKIPFINQMNLIRNSYTKTE